MLLDAMRCLNEAQQPSHARAPLSRRIVMYYLLNLECITFSPGEISEV